MKMIFLLGLRISGAKTVKPVTKLIDFFGENMLTRIPLTW